MLGRLGWSVCQSLTGTVELFRLSMAFWIAASHVKLASEWIGVVYSLWGRLTALYASNWVRFGFSRQTLVMRNVSIYIYPLSLLVMHHVEVALVSMTWVAEDGRRFSDRCLVMHTLQGRSRAGPSRKRRRTGPKIAVLSITSVMNGRQYQRTPDGIGSSTRSKQRRTSLFIDQQQQR